MTDPSPAPPARVFAPWLAPGPVPARRGLAQFAYGLMQPLLGLRKLLRQRPGTVRRRVVHHEDLQRRVLPEDHRNEARQVLAFVIRRDDDERAKQFAAADSA